jgi:hypothetical protein
VRFMLPLHFSCCTETKFAKVQYIITKEVTHREP